MGIGSDNGKVNSVIGCQEECKKKSIKYLFGKRITEEFSENGEPGQGGSLKDPTLDHGPWHFQGHLEQLVMG